MPCEMRMRGQLAAIRLRAELRDTTPTPPVPAADWDGPQIVRLVDALQSIDEPAAGLRLDDLKAELSALVQRELGTLDVDVSDVRFRAGSLEILVLVSATAAIVKEFGSLAQGLREIAALVPGPVKTFVKDRAGAFSGRDVEVRMDPQAGIEMREGMLAAETLSPVRAATQPPADEVAPARPAAPDPDRRMLGYLLATQVMTAALVAAVLIALLIDHY